MSTVAENQRADDSYRSVLIQRVSQRAPLAFAVFVASAAAATLFEVYRFPDRSGLMLGFTGAFAMLTGIGWLLVRRRPEWSVPVMITFVNVIGVAITVYHVRVEADVAWCVGVLSALVGSSAVILPWGRRSQALASVGVLATYPLLLLVPSTSVLEWAAAGTFLVAVAANAIFGATLFARHLRSDVDLTQALSEREARLQSYFDLSLVGTAIVGLDGRLREVNEELCRMFATTRDDLLGTAWIELVEPSEKQLASGLLAQALAGAAGRFDFSCRRHDGATLHTTVAARGLPGIGDVIDHAMILVHDITDRKLAELEQERSLARTEAARRAAEEAAHAKDAFLATISHELRTPLTPILAWADLLDAGNLPGQTGRAISAIKRCAQTQVRLIDDLLDMSRIVSGQWQMTMRPVELSGAVQAAAETIEPDAEAKQLTVDLVLPQELVVVRGDSDRLQQIVRNLAFNAVKFTPSRGRVEIRLEANDDVARIRVRDTGEGIPPEALPHVFERFRQVDASSKRRHGGMGLGLFVVRALVDRLGGTVSVESPGSGKGTTFTVEIPCARDVEAAAITAERPEVESADGLLAGAPCASLNGLRVLVVDDDADSNAVVAAVLSRRGADVRAALSAQEALDTVTDWRPHVVVSDIAMPGKDGVTLLRELREQRATIGEPPTIALTAYATGEERRRMLEAGFQAYVAKPFDPVHLAAVVETAAYAQLVPS